MGKPFTIVDAVESPQQEEPSKETARAASMLGIALKALSQRALVALASLFTLILAGSVFWAFLTILPNPSPLQLIGAGAYAVFVLSLAWMRR